jgi:hypothetical protein
MIRKGRVMDRIILKADEGHIYTDGETYGQTIYLAVGETASAYYQITEEEYNARMKENKKKRQRKG